jgi:YD repeat-containing protein
MRVSSTYDAASRLSEVCDLKSNSTVSSDFQFAYDPAGNRISVLEQSGDRVTWSYDAVYQLTEDRRSGTNAYQKVFTYDAVGNCLVKTVDGSPTTSTFDGADELINSVNSTGTTNYTFDSNGNQSLEVGPTGARTTSIWGYENQVELVKLPSGQQVASSYNADNRRVRIED